MGIGMRRVVNRMTNNRQGEEWYNCERCYTQRPRSQMVVQNGRIVCIERCVDKPGAAAGRANTVIRTEEAPPPLPEIVEDL